MASCSDVREEVLRFAKLTREQRAVPTIKALRQYMLDVAVAEADKTLVVLGDKASEKQKKSVEAMAKAIVNKVLHEPIHRLKEQSARNDPAAAIRDQVHPPVERRGAGQDAGGVLGRE